MVIHQAIGNNKRLLQNQVIVTGLKILTGSAKMLVASARESNSDANDKTHAQNYIPRHNGCTMDSHMAIYGIASSHPSTLKHPQFACWIG